MSGVEPKTTVLSGENVADEHICCAIGNDAVNAARAERKREWLRRNFAHGHTFRKIDVRGKVFIEYMPAEYAWFPVEAPGYAFIQCFWVSGRYKGQGLGARLLEECEAHARDGLGKAGPMNGLVAITSHKKRPFMLDKQFLLKYGFAVVDTAEPYFELVAKRFDGPAQGAEAANGAGSAAAAGADGPRFLDTARSATIPGATGLDFFYTDSCPFNHDFVDELAGIARAEGMETRVHFVESIDEARRLPSAWGIYSLFYNGRFVEHDITPPKKFPALLERLRTE